jgi:drug/metabolite transporter (DMT)-like permease
VVQPLIGTVVVFTLILSWIVNRRIDIFNWKVIAGIVIVLAGTFLIY